MKKSANSVTILLKLRPRGDLFSDGMSPESFMLTLLVPTMIAFLAPSCKLLGTKLGLADDVFWFRENNCNDGNCNRTTNVFI